MDRNRVYIGYDKGYNRRLLYIMNNGDYKDLETKEIITADNIRIESLINYNEIYKVEIPLKSNFLKVFKEHEEKEWYLGKIYIGNVNKVVKILSEKFYGTNILTFVIDQNLRLRPKLFDVLLMDNGNDKYYNMINGDYYTHKGVGYEIGDFFIDRECLTPFKEAFNVQQDRLPKRKVLELYNKKYGGK